MQASRATARKLPQTVFTQSHVTLVLAGSMLNGSAHICDPKISLAPKGCDVRVDLEAPNI